MLGMIVACDRNGAIGKDGDLPWRQSTDLQHFKKITMGSNLIMGRKTWDSLPFKPLPNRRNIVLTSTKIPNVEVYNNINECIYWCVAVDDEHGGGARDCCCC